MAYHLLEGRITWVNTAPNGTFFFKRFQALQEASIHLGQVKYLCPILKTSFLELQAGSRCPLCGFGFRKTRVQILPEENTSEKIVEFVRGRLWKSSPVTCHLS
jgi:hypothetical protein